MDYNLTEREKMSHETSREQSRALLFKIHLIHFIHRNLEAFIHVPDIFNLISNSEMTRISRTKNIFRNIPILSRGVDYSKSYSMISHIRVNLFIEVQITELFLMLSEIIM